MSDEQRSTLSHCDGDSWPPTQFVSLSQFTYPEALEGKVRYS